MNTNHSKPRAPNSKLRTHKCIMDAYEQEAFKNGYRFIAGVDEVGRGPLAGPVVSAAVIFPSSYTNSSPLLNLGIRDSKTLSARQRNKILLDIYRYAISVGLGIIWVDDIETYNIHTASLKAMAIAVKRLNTIPDFILVDGLFPIKDVSIPQLPIIKGDQLSVSIAAASVVAKTVRDSIMSSYHNTFPCYNFIKNKGYGTKEHLIAIKQFGPSPIHRKYFKGVKEYLK